MSQTITMLTAAAGEMPAGSILHFDKELLISIGIYAFNIILLTVLLVFILYKPVKKFMADRAARIEGTLANARRKQEDVEALIKQYEQKIDDVDKEREEILRRAHKTAAERVDHMLMEARREAEAIQSRAMAEMETERAHSMNEMRAQIIEIATLMAGRFVEVSIDPDTQNRYIDEAFADWEEH